MIKLTNLEKVYWPQGKITKGDLIRYYASVAPFILPYLKNRPLVMHRFPEGVKGEAFFQKESGEYTPGFVKTTSVLHEGKRVNYILVQNAKTLLYVANLGSIEMHPFNSTYRKLEKPDYFVFDLDPEAISFGAVIETAQAVHEILEELSVPHFCKTSGLTGLHIYVPLHAKYDYDQARSLAYLLATIVHHRLPKITSLERNPQKRQRKVYIDTLQNIKGQTLVCAYSVRATPRATVSTPLLWKEVKPGLDPEDFTLKTVPKRLMQKGDLFKGVLDKSINLQLLLKKIDKLI